MYNSDASCDLCAWRVGKKGKDETSDIKNKDGDTTLSAYAPKCELFYISECELHAGGLGHRKLYTCISQQPFQNWDKSLPCLNKHMQISSGKVGLILSI